MICLRTAGREVEDYSIDMDFLIKVEAVFFSVSDWVFLNLTGNTNFLVHFQPQEKYELVMQYVGIKWRTSHLHC